MVKKDTIKNDDKIFNQILEKIFYCPKCKKRYNDLEVIHSIAGSYCLKCGTRLIKEDNSKVDNNNNNNL